MASVPTTSLSAEASGRRRPARWGLASLAMLLPVTGAAMEGSWTDPSFEVMTHDAELIVIAGVVFGSRELCQVRALETLKGTAPSEPFWVEGFNSSRWPRAVVDEQSMHEAEVYLLFLRRSADSARRYRVTSPTAGDLPILTDGIHGGWSIVSFPRAAPPVPVDEALTLLDGLIDHQAGEVPTRARRLLAEELTVSRIAQIEGEQRPDVRIAYLDWLLGAQAAYGNQIAAGAVLAAARSPNQYVAAAGARALRSLQVDQTVLTTLAELLSRPGATFVQAEAADTLIALAPSARVASPLLLAALETSDPRGAGPRDIADPLRNQYPSGREAIIRALAHFRTPDATPKLVEMIRDEGLSAGVFDALVDYFRAFPSDAARDRFIDLYARAPVSALPHFHRYLVHEGSPASRDAMARRLSDSKLSLFEAADGLEAWSLATPERDPHLEKTVATLLDRHHNDEAVVFFGGAAISAASQRIALALGRIDDTALEPDASDRLAIIEAAVSLKLQPPPEAAMAMESWLALIDRDGDDGLLGEYLFRELVRSTPVTQRTDLVRRLRTRPLSPAAAAALVELGATMSESESALARRAHPIAF